MINFRSLTLRFNTSQLLAQFSFIMIIGTVFWVYSNNRVEEHYRKKVLHQDQRSINELIKNIKLNNLYAIDLWMHSLKTEVHYLTARIVEEPMYSNSKRECDTLGVNIICSTSSKFYGLTRIKNDLFDTGKYLQLEISRDLHTINNKNAYLLLLFLIMILNSCVSFGLNYLMVRKVQSNLLLSEDPANYSAEKFSIQEFYDLSKKLDKLTSLRIYQSIAETTQNLAHDLKGPLGVFEVIANGDVNDFESNQHSLKQNVLRLQSLIVAISSAELESIVRPTRSDLSLEHVVKQFSQQDKFKQISLIYDPYVITGVYIDLDKVERACANLLLNALDAASSLVKISCIRDGLDLVIAISDDGVGVLKEFRDKIFERGFSTKSSTGLGLDFVRHVAAGHGGSIVYERENGWSTFTLTLINVFPSSESVKISNGSNQASYEKIFLSLKDEFLENCLKEKIEDSFSLSVTDDLSSVEECLFSCTDDVDLFVNELAPRGIEVVFLDERISTEDAYIKIKTRMDPS